MLHFKLIKAGVRSILASVSGSYAIFHITHITHSAGARGIRKCVCACECCVVTLTIYIDLCFMKNEKCLCGFRAMCVVCHVVSQEIFSYRF